MKYNELIDQGKRIVNQLDQSDNSMADQARDFKGYYLTDNNVYLYIKLNGIKYYYQAGQEKELIDYLISQDLLSVSQTIIAANLYMKKQYKLAVKQLYPKIKELS